MKRLFRIMILVLTMAGLLTACGGGGGGGEGGGPQPPAANISGEWSITSTVTSHNCGDQNGVPDYFSANITHDGTSNSFSGLFYQSGVLVASCNGTISGTSVTIPNCSYPEDGGTTTSNVSGTLNTSSMKISGTDSWTYSELGWGSCSGQSDWDATRTGGDAIAPAAPSGLGATAASSSTIDLTWTDNSNNEAGFKIERSTSSTTGFTQIGIVSANITSYTSSSLNASTTYYYRVRAYNSAGDSSYSNTAYAMTSGTGGGTGSLKITNGAASYTMNDVYLKTAGSSSWGTDQLMSTIAVGGTFTLTNIPAGSYDLKVVFQYGATYYQYSITITAGATVLVTATPSAPVTGEYKITNGSSYSMTEMYFVQAGSSSWGVNQLPSSTSIAAGGAFTLTSISPGYHDLKVVFSSGYSYVSYSTNVIAGYTTWAPINGPNTGWLRVVNSSSYTVWDFYLKKAGASSWGSDLLQTYISTGGFTWTLKDIPSGYYDAEADTSGTFYWQSFNFDITAGATRSWTLIN